MTIRICREGECSNTFEPASPNQRYCSRACNKRAYHKRNAHRLAARVVMLTCTECPNVFRKRYPNHAQCSSKCRKKRRDSLKPEIRPRDCDICLTEAEKAMPLDEFLNRVRPTWKAPKAKTGKLALNQPPKCELCGGNRGKHRTSWNASFDYLCRECDSDIAE